MRNLFLAIAAFCLFTPSPSLAARWPQGRPRLVVLIVIDQFRADYLSRYQDKLSQDGFRALMKNGAYYPFGEYDILQSMTGPGHATILTGAYPYQMGIPLNDWYDQKTHKYMYCVEDGSVELLGVTKPHENAGSSPKNLIGTTVGDELKNADIPSRVISIALKDRAAILMGGHRADLALWFDTDSNRWVSSRYYVKKDELPAWIQDLNGKLSTSKCVLSQTCGLDLTTDAFFAAMAANQLGQEDRTDIIAVSYSSHDYAGHIHGPNSPEIEAMTLHEDKAIARIRKTLSKTIPGGLDKVLFVLTGDHGVAATPAYLEKQGIETGYISESQIEKQMEEALSKEFGQPPTGKWVVFSTDFNFYLNEEAVEKAKIDIVKAENTMARILRQHPQFAQVFTRGDWEQHRLPARMFARQIEKTYFASRNGHVIGIVKPFYVNESRNVATHMTGYSYDRTVPILFSGFGIKEGLHAEKAEVIDIAPTLSFILGTIPPALSEGRVLSEALKIESKSSAK